VGQGCPPTALHSALLIAGELRVLLVMS